MKKTFVLRRPERGDIDALGKIAEVDLFPADMMEDIISPFFDASPTCTWLLAEADGVPAGFVYAEEEQLCDSVWNVRAIAVDEQFRGAGAGRALLEAVVQELVGARMIVIDTTQLPEQAVGRALYESCGFALVATIPDYWETGADKVTFAKKT